MTLGGGARISLGSRLGITGFCFIGALCPIDADNASVVRDHWRLRAPSLHVICNASVQWSLFSVKSNYPHKKRSPCASRLSRKKKKKSPRSFSRVDLASPQDTTTLSMSKSLHLWAWAARLLVNEWQNAAHAKRKCSLSFRVSEIWRRTH